MQCVLKARALLIEAEPERRENLDRFTQRERYSDAERLAGLEAGLRQSLCRGTLVSGEHTIAPDLLTELERRSPAARREAIRTTDRYQLFGLAEYLSRASRSAVFYDVLRALEIAALAIEVSDTLDPRIYGRRSSSGGAGSKDGSTRPSATSRWRSPRSKTYVRARPTQG